MFFLELTNICNFNCAFCPSRMMKRGRGYMDYRLIKKIVNEITEKRLTKTVALHLMGEPILHPRITDVISLLYDKGLSVFLNTNGSLLTQRILKKIVNRVDFIVLNIFSNRAELFKLRKAKEINFSAYFKRIEDTVRLFIAGISIKTGLILMYMMPDINVPFWRQTDVVKEQKDILNYWLKNINQTGIVRQMPINEFTEDNFFKCAVKELSKNKSILDEIHPGEKRKYYPLTANISVAFSKLGNWNNRLFFNNEQVIKNNRGFCRRIDDDFCVLWNGDCSLCCGDFNGDMNLGNIEYSSIERIIKSKKPLLIKKANFYNLLVSDLCRRCNGRVLV